MKKLTPYLLVLLALLWVAGGVYSNARLAQRPKALDENDFMFDIRMRQAPSPRYMKPPSSLDNPPDKPLLYPCFGI